MFINLILREFTFLRKIYISEGADLCVRVFLQKIILKFKYVLIAPPQYYINEIYY